MSASPFTAEFPWPAPAKLNLFLHVVGRRPDGYHLLQTVFQFLDFGDSLFFAPRGDGQVRRTAGPDQIAPHEDLVVRAAEALRGASGCNLGADIRVDKRIPVGGGLGGGSSDAATTLVALNRLWNLGLTVDELALLGLKLGADVPVFVRGQAAWAEGLGEKLRPIEPPEPWFLVVTPPLHVSTGEIFNAPELRRDSAPITLEDFQAGRARNDCEPVTCTRHPEVAAALAWVRGLGDGRMSGTGASVFVAFEARATALAAAQKVPAPWRHLVARGLNRSPLAAIMRAR
ncbi:MAG TPA: 4-(cytidine 5'-diphospho)-2-C-methyl-D-erythritol kinase [Solimonas sp.]|nr:4-(cytidine 5'-diphospho)-2-C-methyl-D-erythritol kinase [Solimonas sp.]